MQRRNDCTIREGDHSFLKSLDGYLVAELRAQLVDLVCSQLGHGDQFPVTVSGWNCDAVDRGGIALRRGPRDVQSAKRDNGANAVKRMVENVPALTARSGTWQETTEMV